ncbi:MAG: glutamate-5-semialdehyde dehydrogenase, partial [Spirochaetota bacterium]|nr:glutamate-5-semialdehyde dehydrogenase [Spirochaetota bacterium]
MSSNDTILSLCQKASEARQFMSRLSTEHKNATLERMARLIEENRDYIMSENKKDLAQGEEKGLTKAMLDRLTLDEKRMANICVSLREVIALPDPVYEVVEQQRRPNGLDIGRMRVPIGVIGIIYESRPNVTTEASSLCFKTSNVTILRGGSESIHSNRALVKVIKQALSQSDIPEAAISFVDTTDRQAVMDLLKMKDHIDLIIPRGGEGLINTVVDNSNIPVIKHDKGVCDIYIHEDADQTMSEQIAINAKVQRPSVCNAMENLIVHENYPYKAELFSALLKENVELRGCEKSRSINDSILPATDEDYHTEYLDYILSIKLVSSFEEALSFIEKYGSKHSDSIITKSYELSRRFINEVDSASVFVNASTRFSDGQMFGMGAEIGISTNKLHARGPMGLKELTTTKFIIF